jgi:hypothetical protein
MMQDIIDGLKELLKAFDAVDIGEVDAALNPIGSVAIQIERVTPVAPGADDANLAINIMGLTTADADPDKKIITKLYSNIYHALKEITPEDITQACKCDAELWYMTSSTPPTGGAERLFTIQYNLTIQNFQP